MALRLLFGGFIGGPAAPPSGCAGGMEPWIGIEAGELGETVIAHDRYHEGVAGEQAQLGRYIHRQRNLLSSDRQHGIVINLS